MRYILEKYCGPWQKSKLHRRQLKFVQAEERLFILLCGNARFQDSLQVSLHRELASLVSLVERDIKCIVPNEVGLRHGRPVAQELGQALWMVTVGGMDEGSVSVLVLNLHVRSHREEELEDVLVTLGGCKHDSRLTLWSHQVHISPFAEEELNYGELPMEGGPH